MRDGSFSHFLLKKWEKEPSLIPSFRPAPLLRVANLTLIPNTRRAHSRSEQPVRKPTAHSPEFNEKMPQEAPIAPILQWYLFVKLAFVE